MSLHCTSQNHSMAESMSLKNQLQPWSHASDIHLCILIVRNYAKCENVLKCFLNNAAATLLKAQTNISNSCRNLGEILVTDNEISSQLQYIYCLDA